MAINSLLRRASSSSLIPLSMRSLGYRRQSNGALSEGRDRNTASLLEFLSERGKPDPYRKGNTNLAEHPFQVLRYQDTSLTLTRILGYESTKVVVHGNTYKVKDGNPNISLSACMSLPPLKMEFEAIAEPKAIRIQSMKISDCPSNGHLGVFEEYLGTKAINSKMVGLMFNCFSKQSKEAKSNLNDVKVVVEGTSNSKHFYSIFETLG